MHGIRLPFHRTGDNYCRTDSEHIRQAVQMILTTRPGTRPLEPGFGCRVAELLFRPATPAIQARAVFFIEQAIAQWETRVDRIGVTVEPPDESSRSARLGMLVFYLEYRIRDSGEPVKETVDFGDGQVQLRLEHVESAS